MVKRLALPTRGLGAEPGNPEVTVLASWIAKRRGRPADILTYLLDQSLEPQVIAGIMAPCAGGRFYKNRILQCLIGIDGREATGEIGLDPREISEDAAGIAGQKKGAWCALPAPHVLGITDAFYHDTSEWNDAITGAYRSLMRSMRDQGINGHVLICDALSEPEITSLARQNVLFFQPKPDQGSLACLLEYQQQIAVGRDQLDIVLDLLNEYDLRKIIIVDPDPESIAKALSCLDPDEISAGGYCRRDTAEGYWKHLVGAAVYSK